MLFHPARWRPISGTPWEPMGTHRLDRGIWLVDAVPSRPISGAPWEPMGTHRLDRGIWLADAVPSRSVASNQRGSLGYHFLRPGLIPRYVLPSDKPTGQLEIFLVQHPNLFYLKNWKKVPSNLKTPRDRTVLHFLENKFLKMKKFQAGQHTQGLGNSKQSYKKHKTSGIPFWSTFRSHASLPHFLYTLFYSCPLSFCHIL